MTILIRRETEQDIPAIEAVIAAAFLEATHSNHAEQYIVRELRSANQLAISLVAESDHKIVGHIAVSPVEISDGSTDWYGLGPLAVVPACQGQGIGGKLMSQALAVLETRNAAGCVVLGDARYYTRFGFAVEPLLQLPGVPVEYFLALALRGSARGVVAYSRAFERADDKED